MEEFAGGGEGGPVVMGVAGARVGVGSREGEVGGGEVAGGEPAGEAVQVTGADAAEGVDGGEEELDDREFAIVELLGTSKTPRASRSSPVSCSEPGRALTRRAG
ncbi:hypothetical protein ACFXDE_32895 [Kitasatospora sp. NPDC059408]|uniref:hypothetical protein n=1 Tax=Kitasatospora sp. NPDC059408 TaxID=3346823 RepID=UPI0036754926